MAVSEAEIRKFNYFLELDGFDLEIFEKFYQSIKLSNNFKFKLLDFEYFNEKRFEEARKEKIISVQLGIFDRAAYIRDLEEECQKYIDLKTEFKIEKSAFHFEKNYLLYIYLGTAKNDKQVRAYFKKELN